MSSNPKQFISRKEVSHHNTKKDGWFIIHNHVLDVTGFFDDHPGGSDVLLQMAGQDATEAFDGNNHSKMAQKMMEKYIIGTLPEEEQRKMFSLEEIKNKNTKECAWFVLHNKVYDVTPFLDNHPGGRDVLIWNSGADATKAFEDNNHSAAAKKMLSKFYVGELHPSDRKAVHSTDGERGAASTGPNVGADGKPLAASFSNSGDESLLSRLQEQIKLFVIIGAFILAGVLLLS